MPANVSTGVPVTCPKCRSGARAPATAIGKKVSCRECGTVFVADRDPASAELTEAELTPGAADLPPTSGVNTIYSTGPDEYRLAADEAPVPTVRAPPIVLREETAPDDVIAPPPRASLGWAFFSNTFTFPWTPAAITQWIVSSIMLIVAGELALFTIVNLFSGDMAHVVLAGFLIMAMFWAMFLSLSYLAASLFDITINAAYNIDKAQDWPDPDWRDRVFTLLRLGYLVVLAGVPAAGLGLLLSLADKSLLAPAVVGAEFVLLPIVMLAVLESDSMIWPISAPIFSSLIRVGYGWIVFYLLTGALIGGCAFLAVVLYERIHLLCPLVLGPVFSAAIFIYGRLLGRLTWLILRKYPGRRSRD